MYLDVVIIGIGTLGSFIAAEISELESTKSIVIVDNDIVEEKNLNNSIYRKKDVGNLKTEALFDIIRKRNEEIEVVKLTTLFEEKKTKLPYHDLLIDCRDFLYNRKEIDVRLYITGRQLVIDCRRPMEYKKEEHSRGYNVKLEKGDLKHASQIFSELVRNNTISSLIVNKSGPHMYSLDSYKHQPVRTDILYDSIPDAERLIDLSQSLYPILRENKKSNSLVRMNVGGKCKIVRTIKQNTLNSTEDVVSNLLSATMNVPGGFNIVNKTNNNFLIKVVIDKERRQHFIELYPETGAA